MPENTRQTTLDSPTTDIESLSDIDWTFDGADTSYLTHGLHAYPARMIPQIPDALFDYYKSEGVISEGDTVYDPFSGSGTTAVEGRLHGLHAEGNDINPLACLLSRAKAIPLNIEHLNEARESLLHQLSDEIAEVADRFDAGELDFDAEP